MHGKSGGELVIDNSETVYNHCPLQEVKEDLNSFGCHFQASIYAYLIVIKPIDRKSKVNVFSAVQKYTCLANGYKASRLEGMKSTGPLRCLLVKLNCILFIVFKFLKAI